MSHTPTTLSNLTTERLAMRAVSMADLDPLYAINSDPESWRHDPPGRHTSPQQTAAWIEVAAARWTRDGLSYWTVALADDPHAVVGVGGIQRHATGGWNLYYRLAPAAQGHGYATEMARVAIATAHAVDPDSPVLAWILAHNTASRRVAERLGFTNYGEHVDANDGVRRLMYADRDPHLPEDGVALA